MGIFDERKKMKKPAKGYAEEKVSNGVELTSRLSMILSKRESILEDIGVLLALVINSEIERGRNASKNEMTNLINNSIKELSDEEKVKVLTKALIEIYTTP